METETSLKDAFGARVDIYTTPTCHFCHATKEFFKAHGISYTEHDVAGDMKEREKLFSLVGGPTGVPVSVISSGEGEKAERNIVIGFDEEKLSAFLGLS